MLKKVFKSQVTWFIIGVLLDRWLLQRLPKGIWRGVGGWLWDNIAILIVGILIGIVLCIIIHIIRKGFGGLHFRSPITRTGEGHGDDERYV